MKVYIDKKGKQKREELIAILDIILKELSMEECSTNKQLQLKHREE